jgi:long-chain fatty acid transport protein
LRSSTLPRAAGALLLAAATAPAHAGHGFNLVGFGAESIGMAGADVAVSADSAAVNLNPAGLAQLEAPRWDVYTSPFFALGTRHADRYGNDKGMDNPLGTTSGFSYARPWPNAPTVFVGAGLFVQGGTGFVYDDLHTAFGTVDDMSALFSIVRFAPAIAWRIDEHWRVGATVSVQYAQGRQKVFFDTSDAAAGFFGLRFDGGDTFAPAYKLGLQWQGATVTAGLTYAWKTRLDLKGATLTVNYEDLGFDRVKYGHARLTGLALPREVALGLAWRPTGRWLFSSELLWLDWNRALNGSRLQARDPNRDDLPDALQSLDVETRLDWRDQLVLALAGAYRWDDRTTLRGGFDFTRNPNPNKTISPLFNLGQRVEFTAGFTRHVAPTWDWSMALQYQPPVEYVYDNPQLPFGPGARERYEVFILTFALGWR